MKIKSNQENQVLIGDPIHLHIETEALEKVFVYLRRYYYDGDIEFSFASYEPINGLVDTAHAKPIEGTYTKADVSGLFWSQENIMMNYNDDLDKLCKLGEEDQGYFIFDVFQNDEHQVMKFEIIGQTDDVQMIECDKIEGRLFYKEGQSQGIVIQVAGEEGIEGVEVNAKLLASKGIASLALPICDYGTLKNEFSEVPLETVLNAIDYVKTLPFVDPNKIGLMGGTRGAELVLKIASLRNDIKLVVASNPCDVINQSVIKQLLQSKSSWTLDGSPVAFSKVNKLNLLRIRFGRLIINNSQSMMNIYNHDDAIIDTSLISAKLLLIVGKHDQRWDSLKMAKRIESKVDCQVNVYDAGQVLGGPGCLPTISMNRLAFSLGGTPEGNGISQNRSWHDIIEYIKTNL